MIGIICQDNIEKVGHGLFLNFRLALENYLKQEFKNIYNVQDLDAVDILIIIDEHYHHHVDVWKNDSFINKLNCKNIKTVVFNFERIHSMSFPWALDLQKKLETIINLIQFVSDVEDAALYKKIFVNKQCLSRDTVLIAPVKEKKERILFMGQINNYYPTRREIIADLIATRMPFDVIATNRSYSYLQFLQKINEYKYIFNPLGTGKFVNLRFYEALKLGCIPVQQVTNNMVSWYNELPSSFTFTNVDQITFNRLQEFEPAGREFYLEDYFESIALHAFFR